ncbi:sensor histidine kinase [Brevibacillus nitrificans]|uniref:sensor histidine kinase n=1 Tax=Brevibacillus nitrificans TaxID=651560 RepID=UPI00285DEF2C|nr:sensor histidine kinase [Brevibacillus nitrificans]MDR7319156.1 two-component system sensor histidine kinase YcbA [Brevibacillus nitrificans]
MRERLLVLLIIMLATAFFGEMKVNPLGGSFRFSLGIAAFFFGLLWFQLVPVLLTGFLTGTFILGFRVGLDHIFSQVGWMESLQIHLPSAFYYFSFSLLFHFLKARRYLEAPLIVGLIGASVDFASNMVELQVRHLFNDFPPITWESVFMLLFFGVLRSFFAVGLYNSFSIRQVRAVGEVRQQELEKLRMINTELYQEAFYLRKSMSHLEEITRDSYQLYTRLLSSENTESSAALLIAENVHEVKKDSQRMLAGLSKLINQEVLAPQLPIAELCGLVMRANRKYAEMLGKDIEFSLRCDVNLSTSQIYALLSVLNNLVSNAVEAISSSGWIELEVKLDQRNILFHVVDNGPGIPSEEREWVFQPGYTTKFDQNGNASTGIGLTHAKGIVHSLQGSLQIINDWGLTTHFKVSLPTDQLLRKEGV